MAANGVCGREYNPYKHTVMAATRISEKKKKKKIDITAQEYKVTYICAN